MYAHRVLNQPNLGPTNTTNAESTPTPNQKGHEPKEKAETTPTAVQTSHDPDNINDPQPIRRSAYKAQLTPT